ncbi:hypothetical protein TeGR_g2682 [Tetraparma gracilis]|uniref:Uncharacterized protein n=1 Tax=Tetraparma gracilis TaxID=2962635 RepID=A0ABQ6N2N1_9STRA|nr:hypothetical protein TeGR_g2682 [Tetraparma gracilis]
MTLLLFFSLRSCARRFFDEFLFHIIRNALKRGAIQTAFTVKTHLVALTASEAGRIARSFVSVLMASVTAESAVEEYFLAFPALGELDREYRWFRPMMEAIATELMNKVAYSDKVRAALGAGMSVADMASDSYMINTFFGTGQVAAAKALLIMVGTNLVFQLLVVWLQTRGLKKNRLKTQLFEVISVLTFTKPGLDAYRVASGNEQQAGEAMGPLSVMIAVKAGEMMFEGIPGLVIQSVALVTSKERSTAAVGSLLVSAMSVGVGTATSFYDMDILPTNRNYNEYQGIVPTENRGVAFALVGVLCTGQVLSKALATALLYATESSLLWTYIACDYGLYLGYKLIRRDIIWGYVAMPTIPSVIIAPIYRVFEKAMLDFTGSFHWRLPENMGGQYFLFNMVSTQIGVLAAVHLYNGNAPDEDGLKLGATLTWTAAGALTSAWLALLVYFVARIVVPSRRHTLWSSVTGRQFFQDLFFKGNSEETRMEIFAVNKLVWEKEIGEEVKAWTMENWESWAEEKPAWFTEVRIATVPDNYIPPRFLVGLGGEARERRGSAAESIRQSLRVSFREGAEDEA